MWKMDPPGPNQIDGHYFYKKYPTLRPENNK